MAKRIQNTELQDDNPHGHWQFPDNVKDIPDKATGFIYLITNNKDKKYYIGCKLLEKKVKRAPLKGKKKKRVEIKSSNWKDYTGSSNVLNDDIIKLGKEYFNFQILEFVYSKSELKFEELMYQLMNNALFRDDFYNGIINVRLGKPKDMVKIEDFSRYLLKI